MSATYDLATDIGKVRLLIADTDVVPVTDAHFSDEEIQIFIGMTASLLMAAVYALKAWIASLSSAADSERIGDYSYTNKTVDNMLRLAENYEKLDSSTPAFEWSEMNFTDEEDV